MSKKEKSCFVSDSSTAGKFGDRPPSTYSIKIQNLSQLKNSFFCADRYKSRTFSSGKYNWRLVISPKGNQKDNGYGFISMYVELDNTSIPASIVLAYLTFYVYNKKENKYFTIQDDEEKQFNALKPMWGLDTFDDPKKRYIFEGDQCEFGVDVIVPLTNWEVVSFAQKPSNPKFSWTVNKFSKLKEHMVLKLYPRGYATTYCKSLSIFLYLADGETWKLGEQIYARVDLRILDPFGFNHITRKLARCHTNTTKGWGWNEFVSLAKLQEAYLDKEGSLNVEIKPEVVSTTKYSS